MTNLTTFLSFLQGEYRVITVNVTQDSSPVDLSTASLIKWSVAQNERSNPVLTKSYPASGITIPSPEDGQFLIQIDSDDTSGLDPGLYYHEAIYVIDDRKIVAIAGALRIRPTII